MAQEGKKISFGFSKIIKKPELKVVSTTSGEKKIDYIEYVDDKSMKVIGEEENKIGLLVIPMLGSKTWHDRILNKINADIYREKKDEKEVKIKTDPIKSIDNDSTEKSTNIKVEESFDSLLSLEDQAAQEIICDLKKKEEAQENGVNLVIEQTFNLSGEKEPTLENYEKIPIEQYGMAMLRGMGWEPGRGIGKNAQMVKAVIPKLRAKGIGLGADKVMQQKTATQNQSNNTEKLKLETGCFLKITAGNLGGNYGIVEGFDDDSGRVIVKLALTNKTVSLNDVIVEPVTKDIYEKSSRVLNAAMYEKYKNKIVDEKIIQIRKRNKKRNKSSSEESEDEREKSERPTNYKTSKKNQTSKDRERYSSFSENEDSSNSDERRTKSTRSNDRFENYHKFKKSKKHHHRDHSESSRTKKNHKKDKKREKSEKYKDEKKKHRKHKRSCSKSQSRFSRR